MSDKRAEALALLREARPYIESAERHWQAQHDDVDGEFYMDLYAFEKYTAAGHLLKRIDAAIAE